MMPDEALLADGLYLLKVTEVVAVLRELEAYGIAGGDDSVLSDFWEEFKYQVQRAESFEFSQYEDIVRIECAKSLDGLAVETVALLAEHSDSDSDEESCRELAIQGLVSRVTKLASDEDLAEDPDEERQREAFEDDCELGCILDVPAVHGQRADFRILSYRWYSAQGFGGIAFQLFDFQDAQAIAACGAAMKDHVSYQFELFINASLQAEWMAAAEYSDLKDDLTVGELAVFYKAIAMRRGDITESNLSGRDTLTGFLAVLTQRCESRDFERMTSGAHLFSEIFRCGLQNPDFEGDFSILELESAEVFFGWFIESLIGWIDMAQKEGCVGKPATQLGAKVSVLLPLLIQENRLIKARRDRAFTDLELGRLLPIFDFVSRAAEGV